MAASYQCRFKEYIIKSVYAQDWTKMNIENVFNFHFLICKQRLVLSPANYSSIYLYSAYKHKFINCPVSSIGRAFG